MRPYVDGTPLPMAAIESDKFAAVRHIKKLASGKLSIPDIEGPSGSVAVPGAGSAGAAASVPDAPTPASEAEVSGPTTRRSLKESPVALVGVSGHDSPMHTTHINSLTSSTEGQQGVNTEPTPLRDT